MNRNGNLNLVMHQGNSIFIGDDIEVYFAKTAHSHTVVAICAPKHIKITKSRDGITVTQPKEDKYLGEDDGA